ncbi:MAG: NADH:ubiquinone reductase (Na(+)-transporting) subunit B [Chlamydiales bacterium]|nr:NADH:ubiquinone reductase (Na(+)-transporting) subunit B [Chlamydiales bacterium]
MLRKILDYKLSFFEKGSKLYPLRPLVSAADTFFYEVAENTRRAPHIRDAVDLKRWMVIVVTALLPCILMAIWNTGMQQYVYSSGNFRLMSEFLEASTSFTAYKAFAIKDNRFLDILRLGLLAFMPVVVISYAVGGLWEGIFAHLRGHEIAEGFLVTGMLFPLCLPPTIPYWMVALGVSAGVVIGKELFGGTGMNILNPALTCRAFLYFSFPNKMSGDVWAGTNPTVIANSLTKMNQEADLGPLDGFSQPTVGGLFNISSDIKSVHVDAIASTTMHEGTRNFDNLQKYFELYKAKSGLNLSLSELNPDQLKAFVTSSLETGGLALAPENYQAAFEFASINYGLGKFSDCNLFFGNMLGSMGETSVLACLIGAFILLITRVGSWRTMLATAIGAYATALAFQVISCFALDGGAWSAAKFAYPAYKHFLWGGLAFGLVFMTTDPVSSPALNRGKWIYGFLVGFLTIFIRAVNPAFPEGVMLAILFGNVFAPLIDHYALNNFRRKSRVCKAN